MKPRSRYEIEQSQLQPLPHVERAFRRACRADPMNTVELLVLAALALEETGIDGVLGKLDEIVFFGCDSNVLKLYREQLNKALQPECSICRRRHGLEVQHPCE